MLAEIDALLAQRISISTVYSLLIGSYPDIVNQYCRHTFLKVERLKHDLESIH
jgi:hypothetical protein